MIKILEMLEYADELGVIYVYENGTDYLLVEKYGVYIKVYDIDGLINYIKNT